LPKTAHGPADCSKTPVEENGQPINPVYHGLGTPENHIIINLNDGYQPRNPNAGSYYRCVTDHLQQLEIVYDKCHQPRCSFLNPHLARAKLS
jgi:hypothetical protein